MTTMKLTKNNFEKVSEFIAKNARELDRRLYSYYFENGSADAVIESLAEYQNTDGGFGHGLEPDFRTPSSSAIATCLAVQYMERVGISEGNGVLQKAIDYFSSSYSKPLGKWRPVPNDVNGYPHAPWWHIDEKTNLCVIDLSWENPTVEILGYLQKYPNPFNPRTLRELVGKAIDSLLSYDKKTGSEHSVYCYLSFYSHSKEETKAKINSKLSEIVLGSVNTNPNDWETKYVPKPLQFVDTPSSPFYSLLATSINQNLDLLVRSIDHSEAWFPTWKWTNFKNEWQEARIEWSGKISVDNLVILQRFSRIDDIP